MTEIRIDFVNLESTLNREKNIILDALNLAYPGRVSLTKESPDIIFYGEDKTQSLEPYKSCRKVYVAQENKMPNFRFCDYALSYLDLKDKRNLRLPFYVHQVQPEELLLSENPETILKQKTKFCAFVVSNQNARRGAKRLEFFHKLSKYKKVDSGGKVLNNIGYMVGNKAEFLRDYKFTIAFENRSYPGYTSEKIVHGMKSHCMPIYWGNPEIEKDFNPKSFINVHDFKSFEEAIERIIELDQNDDLYLEALRQPYFHGNIPNLYFDLDRLAAFLKPLVESPEMRTSPLYFKDMLFNLKKNFEPYIYR